MPATLHDLLSQQAALEPHRVALVADGRQVTYGELEAASNRLAHALRQMGVGPDLRVAICLERSIDLVAGILGIMKAGGAYVALDPTHPLDRRRYMLADSGAAILLSHSRFGDRFPGYSGRFVSLDDEAVVSGQPADPPTALAGPEHLAYVIYTSGSTGTPKGVLVEHCNVMSSLRGLQARFPAGPDDVWLFKSNHTFDASLLEMFGAMWHGGRAAILPPGDERDPLAIVRAIDAYGVTHAFFVPSAMQALLDVCAPDEIARLRSLKHILVGGEAMTRRFATQLRALPLEARIANVYGPTETAIICTACMLDEAADAATIPIGQPLGALTAHILDDRRQPVAPGDVGELYISGASVARGYLHAPELTTQRFLDDPFVPGSRPADLVGSAGTRMYKTGDLCRTVAGGQIEFVGRVDRQIKIRGYRVELGEIEVALAAHPDVRDAVVTASDVHGDLRLTAYCVATSGETLDFRRLRAFLRQSLPDHMVPIAWVQLGALPLNENGKVDRAALPQAPALPSDAPSDTSAIDPHRVIADAWIEELGLTAADPDDDFFALGGHSLAAARVITRLRAALHKEISVSDLYRAPTLARFERVVREAPDTGNTTRVSQPIATVGGIPLPYEALGYWVYWRAGLPHLNVVGRRRVEGRLDRGTLAAAAAQVVAAHPALRCRLGTRLPILTVQEPRAIDVSERDLTTLPAARRNEAALASFDELTRIAHWPPERPLLVVRLLQIAQDVSEVQVCMPHAVSDEASLQIVFEDLSRSVHDVASGAAMSESPDEQALAMFVREEREALAGSLRRHFEFWDGYFAHSSPLLFPEDEVVPDGERSESVYLELPETSIDAVRRLAREQALGFSELLYAAALAAVAPYVTSSPGHERRAVAFAPRSMRDAARYERAVGCFVRADGLEADVSDEPDLVTLAHRLRRSAVETEPYQRCPVVVKSAALQKHRWQRQRLHDLGSRAVAAVAALLPGAEIDYDVALAHLRLASLRRVPVRDFALVINILNSFVTPPERSAFGHPLSHVPSHPTLEPPVRRLLEIYFLREPNAGNAPMLMLNGDLNPAFRRRLGTAVIAAIEHAYHASLARPALQRV